MFNRLRERILLVSNLRDYLNFRYQSKYIHVTASSGEGLTDGGATENTSRVARTKACLIPE